jgi:hypothetical protein
MNRLKITLLLVFALAGLDVWAQMPVADPTSVRANEAIDKMTSRFHAFLSKPQKLVYKQKSDQSPSKYIYVLRDVQTKEVSSEMKATDSGNVPFNGYVQFTLGIVNDSGKCGAIEVKSPALKASVSSADALKFADKPECFAPASDVALPLVLHVNFAYQRTKWVVKSVTRGDGKRDPVFTAAILGLALDDVEVVDDADGVAFNSGWKALLTPN